MGNLDITEDGRLYLQMMQDKCQCQDLVSNDCCRILGNRLQYQ